MNILLTNHELLMPGGSETYCVAMAEEYKRRGHNVIIHTPKPGTYVQHINAIVPVVPLKKPIREGKYDITVIHHRPNWETVKEIRCFKIWNSNSKYDIEMPVEQPDLHTAISEEVQESAEQKGFNAVVVRNGINCDKFKPKTPLSKNLGKVLLITNHFPGVVSIVEQACKLAKVQFKHIGQPHWVADPERYINGADLVISLGRGIYEAMACGRNCIVYDYNGAGGFVTPDTLREMQPTNCSGRDKGERWTPERLAEEFQLYDSELGGELQEIALREYNIRNVIDTHLEAFYQSIEDPQ